MADSVRHRGTTGCKRDHEPRQLLASRRRGSHAGCDHLWGSISDSTFRAHDENTGKVPWETKPPVGPEGISGVREVAGREYVVMMAYNAITIVTIVGVTRAQRNSGNNTAEF